MANPNKADKRVAEKALAESEAQIKIIKALAPYDRADRTRIMLAVVHIVEADMLAPGLLKRFVAELQRDDTPKTEEAVEKALEGK
jgi:hypothetical protein